MKAKCCLAILTLFTIAGASMASPFSSGPRFRVEFREPLDTEQIVQLMDAHQFNVLELYSQHDDVQAGYTIADGLDLGSAIQRFREQHAEFLTFAIQEADEILSRSAVSSDLVGLVELRTELSNVLAGIPDSGVRISAVVLTGADGIDSLVRELLVSRVEKLGERSEVQTKSLSHELWAPYSGTSDVNQSRTYQTFYFDDTSGFGSNSTYEQETQVYDCEFADYDGYWSSNMPSSYYDTPFLDDIDNFTIGTSRASNLVENRRYYTYMRLTPGSSGSATVRIKGQKGHRFPSFCDSTWCIFADATTGSMAVFTAPAGLSWSY